MRHRVTLGLITLIACAAAVGGLAWPGVAQASKAKPLYYVSVGDSYSVGYQPGLGATTGYTGYVAKKFHLTLANFGCAGATTTSIIDTVGCPDVLPRTTGARAYPTTTQAAAAEAFLTAHRGRVGLITVSIGGNDVTACAAQASPLPCVTAAVDSIKTNVTSLVMGLRATAGPKVRIIGLTYPDVILGEYVYPALPATPARTSLASLSVVAFKSLINPSLAAAYRAGNGSFVDVTAATGAYTALTKTTTLAPYGSIPSAVAKVCTLTWFCKEGNIHATTKGYALIGRLVAARYAVVRKA
jgi:lysophospholipase L1-like esterase